MLFLAAFLNTVFAAPANFTQEQLAFMPATTQLALFKEGIITPVDVVKAQITQYKKTNKKVNAVTYTFFGSAMRQAQKSAKRYKNGTYRPLEGITVGLKDEHHDVRHKISQGSLVHKGDAPKTSADPEAQQLIQLVRITT